MAALVTGSLVLWFGPPRSVSEAFQYAFWAQPLSKSAATKSTALRTVSRPAPGLPGACICVTHSPARTVRATGLHAVTLLVGFLFWIQNDHAAVRHRARIA